MENRIVPATSREVNIDADYLQWIADIKTRYRQSHIKASLSVNGYVLEFYWGLGRDIMDQISLDLKAEFPGEKGFSTQNLYRMAKFYSFYSGDDIIFSQVVKKIEPSGFPTVLGMIPGGIMQKLYTMQTQSRKLYSI